MNKHTKLIVSLLFIGIIVLAVAITRFYSRTEKSAVSNDPKSGVEKTMKGDEFGNHPFQNSEGLVGIIDSSEHIIVSPEWQSIRLTGNKDRCIATKLIRSNELYGCIDFDGNIIVPFVYSKIDTISTPQRVLYSAITADNKSTVVYNSNFDPCFSRTWDKCEYKDDMLKVTLGCCTYNYTVRHADLILKNTEVNLKCMDRNYKINIIAEGLTEPMLDKICSSIGNYMNYAYSKNAEEADVYLRSISKAPRANFSKLFPDEKAIINRKLISLSDITVEPLDAVNNIPRYAAHITAGTGITYKNEENMPKRLTGEYEAVIVFIGGSENDFKAVSGSFTAEKPDYPAPAPEVQTDVQTETGPQEN